MGALVARMLWAGLSVRQIVTSTGVTAEQVEHVRRELA